MAYREGREARRNSMERNANPYPPGPFHASWDEGWRDSDAILRAMAPYQREG